MSCKCNVVLTGHWAFREEDIALTDIFKLGRIWRKSNGKFYVQAKVNQVTGV